MRLTFDEHITRRPEPWEFVAIAVVLFTARRAPGSPAPPRRTVTRLRTTAPRSTPVRPPRFG